MAEEINFIYQRVQDLANKDQASDYISPEDFNREIKQAQMDEIAEQRQRFEAGFISSDNLTGIKKTKDLFVPSNGLVSKPSDYLFFDTATIEYYYKDANGNQQKSTRGVELISDAELGQRLTSQIKKVDSKHPVCVLRGSDIQVFPQQINKVKLYYIYKPEDPNWTYDVVDEEPVFNSSLLGYQNISLSWQLVPSLIRRVCSQLGIALRQGDLVSIMEQKQDKNQM